MEKLKFNEVELVVWKKDLETVMKALAPAMDTFEVFKCTEIEPEYRRETFPVRVEPAAHKLILGPVYIGKLNELNNIIYGNDN